MKVDSSFKIRHVKSFQLAPLDNLLLSKPAVMQTSTVSVPDVHTDVHPAALQI